MSRSLFEHPSGVNVTRYAGAGGAARYQVNAGSGFVRELTIGELLELRALFSVACQRELRDIARARRRRDAGAEPPA